MNSTWHGREAKVADGNFERSFVVLESQIKSTAEAVDDIQMRVSSIDRALRGNGSAGLFEKAAVMEKRIEHLEEFTSEMRRLRTWITTGVVAVLGSLVWSAVKTVIGGG